jgi:4-amino-4-deoxy-L-arabinose transferase-like glycosyltransferase
VPRTQPADRARLRAWAPPLALVALAAALRLPGLDYGLPFPLLNPDERSLVPRAWSMGNGGGLDPGWYDYPSLLLALLAPLQAPFDAPSYGAARVVAVLVGIGGVAAAWWLGRVAYGRAAGVVAGGACAVATAHVVYSHMAVTDVLLTTLVTLTLALAVTGRLEWAGLAAGLAASAKYPGVLLALPLVAAGWREWRRLAAAAALAAVAFALTSPFVLLNAGAAWADLRRVQRLAADGWLGFEHDHPTPLAFLDRLWESLGPFLLVAGAGLALALARLVLQQHKLGGDRLAARLPPRAEELVLLSHELRPRPAEGAAATGDLVLKQHKLAHARADLALVLFGLVWFAQLLTIEAHFDRYVLPLVPVLGALAGRVRPLVPVSLALLVVPLAWSVGEVRELTRTDTRLVAHGWIGENVPVGASVAAESSTPPVEPRQILALRLPGPGFATDPNRDVGRLRARGVEYVLVSGAVADRVLAAAGRYPAEARFYRQLDLEAERVLHVVPGDGLAGPWVALYRL